MYRIPLILLSIAAGLFLESCKGDDGGCPEPSDETILLYPGDKGKVPYTGKEVLIFKSDKGDSLGFIGEGKVTSFDSAISNNVGVGCGGDMDYFEVYSITFKTVDQSKGIGILLSQKSLNTEVAFLQDHISFETVFIDHGQLQGYMFYDSIFLHSKMWYRVRRFTDATDTLYYNKANGIIRYITSDKKVWDKN